MLAELPSDTDVFRALLGDLYDDLPGRVARLRLLSALDEDFGTASVMLPGGDPTYLAYVEARSSFVSGNYVAVILLSQAMVENLLGAHLIIDGVSRSIHGEPSSGELAARPLLGDVLTRCRVTGLLTAQDEANIRRLRSLRNPLTHFRKFDDPTHLSRRATSQGTHAFAILEGDARFSITTVIQLLGKPAFALGRQRNGDDE